MKASYVEDFKPGEDSHSMMRAAVSFYRIFGNT